MQQKSKTLPDRWTRDLLSRCTAKELIIVIAAYGLEPVVQRLGDAEYQRIVQKVSNQ